MDAQAECEKYEKQIEAAGGIDIQIGGIGSNGHIAFNEPGTPFDQPTHVVQLKESTIKDNARFFDGDMSQVPTEALTIGLGTIMGAKEVYILSTGAGKADAIQKSVEGNIVTTVPASVLQFHPNATFFCDEAAAENLYGRYPRLPLKIKESARPGTVGGLPGIMQRIHE